MKIHWVLLLMLLLYLPLPALEQRLAPPRKYNTDDDDDNGRPASEEQDEEVDSNTTGQYVGATCEGSCSSRLLHVHCDEQTNKCVCEKKYPVKLNPNTGCSKPKLLGEPCFYKETCQYADSHASCIQIHHNAICQCQDGYHTVTIQKPSKRVFCAEDLVVMTTDFTTFAGVLSGIAVLSGLICFVLHLFNKTLYETGGRRRLNNANLPPPILFSSDAGSMPSRIQERSVTSRASTHRSVASLPSRRPSSAQLCRGAQVSRTGSRRPSLASVHSGNSIRSYSTRRYEREREQKEEREMQRRLGKMTRSSSVNSSGKTAPPTPSPHSTDDLLPTLEEDKQIPPLAAKEDSASSFQEELPSTSKQFQ